MKKLLFVFLICLSAAIQQSSGAPDNNFLSSYYPKHRRSRKRPSCVYPTMNKTCKYCGIVPEDHICPYSKKRYSKYQKDSAQNKFRNLAIWQKKRELIKQRDRYLCQVCITGLFDTLNELTYKDLEVHHIVPIEEDYDLRLDDDNLITLCGYHHKMAEQGKISREFLKSRIQTDR